MISVIFFGFMFFEQNLLFSLGLFPVLINLIKLFGILRFTIREMGIKCDLRGIYHVDYFHWSLIIKFSELIASYT